VKVYLTSSLLVSCHYKSVNYEDTRERDRISTRNNGYTWAILGDKTGRVAAGRQYQDGAGSLLGGSGYSSECHRFYCLGWPSRDISQLIIQGRVADRSFGEETSFRHHQHWEFDLTSYGKL